MQKKRKVLWTKEAIKNLTHWGKNGDYKKLEKIQSLIENILVTPFGGLGKPEPLTNELSGYWSRRITGEHRLVYSISDDNITIISCQYHYLN